VLKWALILIGIIAVLAVMVLAVPVNVWRTGEVPLPGLQHLPPASDTLKPTRVWVDTDAACGTGQRRDPDDCLALLWLAGAADIDTAGISTVFGNAPVSEADQVMLALAQTLASDPNRQDSAPSTARSVFKG
jgi:purine nucleosidase